MSENELAVRLKALADPRRLTILRLLANNDLCVTALARRSGVSKAAVSQHLKVLREAGFVRGEKRGYWTHYSVDNRMVSEVGAMLEALVRPTHTSGECLRDCRHDGCHLERERGNQ